MPTRNSRSIHGFSQKQNAIKNEAKERAQANAKALQALNQAAAVASALRAPGGQSRRGRSGADSSTYDHLGRLARQQSSASYVPGAPSSLKKIPHELPAPAHIRKYVEMMLNVHDTDPVQAPSPVPFRSTAAKQVLATDLATSYFTYAGAAQFYGEVQPNLDNTMLLTTPVSSMELAGTFYTGDAWMTANSTTIAPILAGYMYSAASNNIMVAGTSLEGGTTSQLQCFPLVNTNAVATVASCTISSYTTIDEPITIGFQVNVAGTWSSLGSAVLVPGGTATFAALTLPAGYNAITFTAQTSENGDKEFIRFGFTVTRTSGGTWRLGQVPKNVTAIETTILQNVSQLQYSRITALDVLGTFQGADMTNGGTIACARVPKFWGSQSSNGYSELQLLPYDSYDGELKHGWHVHWVPTCLDDISPTVQVEQFDSFGSTKLVFGGNISTAGQSVRVRCSIVVEYFSTAPSYGPMSYTPPPNDMALALYYVATQIPACTSNREHIVKKLGSLGAQYLGRALAYLKQHPELLLEVGSSIAAAVL